MTKFLDKTLILTADDFEYVEVECPEWGGNVSVRNLSATEREDFAAKYGGGEKDAQGNLVDLGRMKGAQASIVATCLVDDDKKPVFEDPNEDVVSSLGRKNAKVIERIFKKVLEISGMGEDAIDTAGKGSDKTPDDDSSTD